MPRRFYTLRDAPRYLAMDARRFNADVRPYLTEIPLGPLGVGFDREEMDAWADRYIERFCKPPERELDDMPRHDRLREVLDEVLARKKEPKPAEPLARKR